MSLHKKYYLIRLLLNILFISFILYVSVINNNKDLPLIYIFIYNIVLFAPAWINNFWLLRNLESKKSFLHYIFQISVVFATSVFILGSYWKWLLIKFSSPHVSDFTPLAVTSIAPESLISFQNFFDVFPGIIILIILMIIGYVIQKFILKIKIEKEVNIQHTIAELNLLKSQISPHFLFNVLNSLYALSLKKAEETPDVILKLSDILRYSLYETKEIEISIEKEIHILNTYIEIERLRMHDNANISFQHTDVNLNLKIAPMLLLPIIENAFKHGTESTIGFSFIEVKLICIKNKLIFNCKNNFKHIENKDFGGIGIENIQKRLEMIYPEKHSLEIETKNDIYNITLEIRF